MALELSKKTSVFYHDIFNYPLTKSELEKWELLKKIKLKQNRKIIVENKDGFYFLKGRKKIVEKRKNREKYSKQKLKIATKATKKISFFPSILFVGITGALAMNNASKNSDIDLLIITKKNTLWTTRLILHTYLFLHKIPVRRAGKKEQKDKLCLNMWLSENDLIWPKKDRNIYTAHEVVQIIPLANKSKTYEKFLYSNKWVLDYWPKAIKIEKTFENLKVKKNYTWIFFENFFYLIQRFYMRKKVTREVVAPSRAIFHPNDWGKMVLQKLNLI